MWWHSKYTHYYFSPTKKTLKPFNYNINTIMQNTKNILPGPYFLHSAENTISVIALELLARQMACWLRWIIHPDYLAKIPMHNRSQTLPMPLVACITVCKKKGKRMTWVFYVTLLGKNAVIGALWAHFFNKYF